MDTSKHSIIIIDDHPIIHEGLKILFETEESLSIAASASSAEEAMNVLSDINVDLAIIDLSLGDSDGTYLIQKIHNQYPRIQILVYSMSEEKLFGERVAMAGARGYVMKTSSPSILKEAIYTLLDGELFFSSSIQERLFKKEIGRSAGSETILDNLSNREMDVFKLVGQGLDTIRIGSKLNISRNTVDTHRINIKNKLELENGKALDRFAYGVITQGNLPKKK